MRYNHIKNYDEFRGVDLKSTDIRRPRNFASGGQDCELTDLNEIQKRRGYKYKTSSIGCNGLYSYNKVNLDTGVDEPELIALEETGYTLIESFIEIDYSGTSEDVILDFFLDENESQFRMLIKDGDTELINILVGKGFDEITTQSLADLKTAIDLVADLSMTIDGEDVHPVAFLPNIRQESLLPGTTLAIQYEYWQVLCGPENVFTPLQGSIDNKDSKEYEIASATNLQNCLYMTNGYNPPLKYDGRKIYRMGLPAGEGIIISASSISGGGLVPPKLSLTGTIKYIATYLYTDFQGNIIESEPSLPVEVNHIVPTNYVLINLDKISKELGFDTDSSEVNGSQFPVNTINLKDPHPFKVGDIVSFYNGIPAPGQPRYARRKITDIPSPTQITIDGDPVSVAGDSIISNNLVINIYGTLPGGSIYYFLGEVSNGTDVFADYDSGVNLNNGPTSRDIPFNFPQYPHNPPPSGKYITTHKNSLIISGDINHPNRVYFSDLDGAEFFPTASHAFDVQTGIGDKVTGLGSSNEQLIVFKDESIFTVSGDTANLNFRQDELTLNIGCASHASIQQAEEGTLYFLSNYGPYQILGGQLPRPVGPTVSQSGQAYSRIEPFFTAGTHALKRAIAAVDRLENRYYLYAPFENSDSTIPTEKSRMWVYDYERDSWFPEWTNINAGGGMAYHNNKLWWLERDVSGGKLAQRSNTWDEYDFADHIEAISKKYITAWEHVGEPSIFKKFLRLNIMALKDIESSFWNLIVKAEIDFYKDIFQTNTSMPFGDISTIGWGLGSWGEFSWGEFTEKTKKIKLKNNKAKSIRFTFENNELHKNSIITGYEVEMVAPFRNIKE